MITGLHAWSTLTLAASSSADPWLAPLAIGLAGAALAAVIATLRLRRVSGELQAQSASLTALQAAHKALQEREQKNKAVVEERRNEWMALKQDVAAQRKKNHAAQEELKRLREELREQTRLRLEAVNTRPAFAEVAETRQASRPPSRLDTAAKEGPAPEQTAPQPAPAAAIQVPAPPTLSDEQLTRLTLGLSRVEAEARDLASQLALERAAASELKSELKKQRRRAEDFRRIDIITKSKVELMEDKLRHLGREYYEAISELAALKGHVVPPRPRDLPPERDHSADGGDSGDSGDNGDDGADDATTDTDFDLHHRADPASAGLAASTALTPQVQHNDTRAAQKPS